MVVSSTAHRHHSHEGACAHCRESDSSTRKGSAAFVTEGLEWRGVLSVVSVLVHPTLAVIITTPELGGIVRLTRLRL